LDNFMDNEKIENLLNLALSTDEEERMRSPELSAGFEPETDTWEVIVRYFGELSGLRTSYPNWQITELLGGYAVIRLPQSQVETLAGLEQIQYVEKPKQLYFEAAEGRRASCMLPVQTGRGTGMDTNLTGAGVLVGIIDSGIDYLHPDFIREDGASRIVALWDQTATAGNEERPPFGYTLGVEYSAEQIDRALAAPNRAQALAIVPETDSGHGTHVAGIAAGNGRASGGAYRGVAYESELLVVKLGTPGSGSFPRTTELMTGVDYCLKKAAALGKPIAINLSFGNNYGSHSGTSLLETYLNGAAGYGKCSIVAGSGNEGAKAAHTSGILSDVPVMVELAVSDYESSLNVQLWKSYMDEFSVELIHPNQTSKYVFSGSGTGSLMLGDTRVLIYIGQPSPYSPYQEIYFELLGEPYVDTGIWQIRLTPRIIREGSYDLWLPAGAALNSGTGFLRPTVDTTLTIPSTASGVLTVGAYDAYTDAPASFSGRGYTWALQQVKPDLVAPGVDVISCAPNGGYVSRSGTSMATPFVTGAAALLMQWGIVGGRDPYLYGEKLRAYFHRGARALPGFTEYPNPQVGYGALCVKDSLPE
jgi:subtilisin family serine protease